VTELYVDPNKMHRHAFCHQTGIYVRAKRGDRYFNVDIAELDKASLLAWLRSRGGDNAWAENTVGIILGHGPLREESQ
jgi:hypothetical protein